MEISGVYSNHHKIPLLWRGMGKTNDVCLTFRMLLAMEENTINEKASKSHNDANSIFKRQPRAEANLLSVFMDGLALPFSNLLISA